MLAIGTVNKMAEGTPVQQDDVMCRYFSSSSCRDGDRCLFSHNSTRHIPDSVCRYYLKGMCVFGENCKYGHVRIEKGNSSKQNDRHSAGPPGCSANRDISSNVPHKAGYKKNSLEPTFSSLSSNSLMNEVSNSNAPCLASTNWINAPEFVPKTGISSSVPTFSSLSSNTLINEVSNSNAPGHASTNWINAPEFVPKTVRLYADTLKANTVNGEPEKLPSSELCSNFSVGELPFLEQYPYVHDIICELCHKACLHPFDEKQRKAHTEECEKKLEQDMELSFAIQRSMDKICGICMDVVLEKEPLSERRFGILDKCNHIYCLSCIRKWRKQYEINQHVDNALNPAITRTCPECRVASDFITPSLYFVDSEEEKKKLISEYKKSLSKKNCKYFKQGEGTCPFGGSCFYLHAKPDGTKVDLPFSTRRLRQNEDGKLDYMGQISLWDFFEYREEMS